jgi:hypothetical protein
MVPTTVAVGLRAVLLFCSSRLEYLLDVTSTILVGQKTGEYNSVRTLRTC